MPERVRCALGHCCLAGDRDRGGRSCRVHCARGVRWSFFRWPRELDQRSGGYHRRPWDSSLQGWLGQLFASRRKPGSCGAVPKALGLKRARWKCVDRDTLGLLSRELKRVSVDPLKRAGSGMHAKQTLCDLRVSQSLCLLVRACVAACASCPTTAPKFSRP